MKAILLTLLIMATAVIAHAQDDPAPIGYKLKRAPTLVKVYQSKYDAKGKVLEEPDTTSFKKWNSKYWFVADITKVYKNGGKFIRIMIPNGLIRMMHR